ncbi:ArnT family glycosyltransferase [Duganella levis]|uniref:Glycosyltransferase RgtA/B/C/D-like domain-containing protein n=1 Tax=Duganella levis TaxID=2692169 RepID=A0ABW9W4W8_9BURK|nr:glycosyltransferase family 39 protein [Duganella levis]MYN29077.1 hypothetical protein [Duganella levis]
MMRNRIASGLDRHPSYRNTLIAIAAFAILSIIFFHVWDGASVFFGNTRPRFQSFMTLSLSGIGLAVVLLLAGPPRLPQERKFSVPALLLLSIAICAVIGWFSFASYAWSGDEYAYLFQADTLKALRLWNTPPPLGAAETTTYIWIKDAKWVAQYPPGWPLILALFGGSLPTGRLANGVCTAIAAYAVFELVKVRANREAAWIAVLFFVLTPFTLFNGGSLFSHTSAAAMGAVTMLVSYHARQSQRLGLLIALGMCIGLLGLTRNVAAVAVVVAVAIDQVRAGKLITRVVCIGLGGIPFLAGLLAYQYAITGHPTMPVYWYAGRTVDHLYFDLPSIKEGLRHTLLSLPELALFTSPVILLLWISAIWKMWRTKTLAASDIILPIGVLLFVFYPLHPGHRLGPRYYFDFWPLAVVTIGAALPRFSALWRNLYTGALAVSVVYAATISAFLVFEMRAITLSRFDIYELAKNSGMTNALVCAKEVDESSGVYAKLAAYGIARNGVDIGEPRQAAAKDVIFANCRETPLAVLKAAYPERTIWEYKAAPGKHAGKLQPMQD